MNFGRLLLFGAGQLGMMALARFFFQWIAFYPLTEVGDAADPIGDPAAKLFGAAAAVGLLFLGFRFFDAVTDPIAGAISDGWVRKGRERRSLLWFSLALPPVGLALIFAPDGSMPYGLRWGLISVGMFVFFVGYTFYAIPYWSLINDYSDGDADTRRSLSNILGAGLLGATMVGFVVSGILIEKFGYRNAALMFAAPALVLMMLPYFAQPPGLPPSKVEPDDPDRPSGFSDFLRAFTHRRFVAVLLIFSGSQMSFAVMTAAAAFIVTRLLGGTEKEVGLVLGPFLVAALPCFLFVPWLSRKLGWEKAIAIASLALGVVYIGTAFLGEPVIYSEMVTAGILFGLGGPMAAVLLGLEGEAVTECARETGAEVTSVYFGVFNLVIKGMNAIAIFLTTLLGDAAEGDLGTWAVRGMGVMAGCMLGLGVLAYYLVRPKGEAHLDPVEPEALPRAQPGGAHSPEAAAGVDALGDAPPSLADLPPPEGDGTKGLMDTVAEDD